MCVCVCDVELTNLKSGSWQASQCMAQGGGVHWLMGVLCFAAKLSKQIPQGRPDLMLLQ